MFSPSLLRCWTIQSIAAMTCDVGRAVARRHLDRDDASAGSGTDEVVIGLLVLLAWRDGISSRDQTRHVGAVAIGVDVGQIRSLRVEREVGAVDHLHVDARQGATPESISATSAFPGPTPLPHLVQLRVLRHLPPGTGMLVRIDAVRDRAPNRGRRRRSRRSIQSVELADRNLAANPSMIEMRRPTSPPASRTRRSATSTDPSVLER